MHYRRLGTSGLKVSTVSLGSFRNFQGFDDDPDKKKACQATMERAYELGVNFFDGAEAYGQEIGDAERFMGEVITRNQWPRNSYIVSTKAIIHGHGPKAAITAKGLNRKHLTDCLNEALQRYRLDYIDLFFCHRPDPDCSIEETCRAMDDLIRQGKTMYWGVSCHYLHQVKEIYEVCEKDALHTPVTEQIKYSVTYQDAYNNETRHFTKSKGLGITAHQVLDAGILTGQYLTGTAADFPRISEAWWEKAVEPQRPLVTALKEFANRLDTSVSALCLALALQNRDIATVIVGASSPAQIEENVKASELAEQLDEAALEEAGKILAQYNQPPLVTS